MLTKIKEQRRDWYKIPKRHKSIVMISAFGKKEEIRMLITERVSRGRQQKDRIKRVTKRDSNKRKAGAYEQMSILQWSNTEDSCFALVLAQFTASNHLL